MNKVTIIGSGPAGLTAAIYAARAALEPVVYAGLQHGGQLTTTTEIENFPGFAHGIMGPQLMNDMSAQAERVGTKIIFDEITKVDLSKRPFKVWAGDQQIETETLIIATGATAKTLGLPREAELMGRGLSTCATCDGFFYKGKRVVVTGGGDSAMEEANYLTKMCESVLLVHRRDYFRASPIMLERAKKNPKIKFMLPYQIVDTVTDDKGLKAVVLQNADTGDRQVYAADGLFMAIGHKPNSDVFKGQLEMDAAGYIKTGRYTETKIPGVFSAGDISDSVFRQAITAAGLGCQAAMQAQRFLEEHE